MHTAGGLLHIGRAAASWEQSQCHRSTTHYTRHLGIVQHITEDCKYGTQSVCLSVCATCCVLTESAHWAGSVIESRCPSVSCMVYGGGFFWCILVQPEQVGEVSAGVYQYSQSMWLRFLLEYINTAIASDWGFCRSISIQPEQVTEVSAGVYQYSQSKWLRFLLEYISTARASDWGFCWSILVQPEQVTEVSAGVY